MDWNNHESTYNSSRICIILWVNLIDAGRDGRLQIEIVKMFQTWSVSVTSAVSWLDSCWAWITVRFDALDTLFCSSSSPELELELWSSWAPLAMISPAPELITGRGGLAVAGSEIQTEYTLHFQIHWSCEKSFNATALKDYL